MFWFLFVCALLLPVIMAFAGYMMWKHPPKEINNFFGYRTSRSMKNTDTWKFAHEYCGKLWFGLGLVMLVLTMIAHIPFYNSSPRVLSISCMGIMAVQTVILLVSIFPTELALKRKFQNTEESADENSAATSQKNNAPYKKLTVIVLVVAVLILILSVVMMFTGNVTIEFGDTHITAKATFYSHASIAYDDIDEVRLRENIDFGIRTFGFGSPKLSVGTFDNDEFGSYTLYAYTGAKACVMIRCDQKIFIITGKDDASTKEIYQKLTSYLPSDKD